MILCSETQFLASYKSRILAARSLRKCKENMWLPLKPTPLLANIFGHLISDGGLAKNVYVGDFRFYGTKEKLLSIKKDIEMNFNLKPNILRHKVNESYELRYNNASFYRILRIIGVPSGDKVIQPFLIPEWIMTGRPPIKRAFLQAVCDDEMSTPKKYGKNKQKWTNLRLRFSKSQDIIGNGVNYLNQYKELFESLGIKSSSVRLTSYFHRKDGRITRIVYISLSFKKDNRIQFFRMVNFHREKEKRLRMYFSISDYL